METSTLKVGMQIAIENPHHATFVVEVVPASKPDYLSFINATFRQRALDGLTVPASFTMAELKACVVRVLAENLLSHKITSPERELANIIEALNPQVKLTIIMTAEEQQP